MRPIPIIIIVALFLIIAAYRFGVAQERADWQIKQIEDEVQAGEDAKLRLIDSLLGSAPNSAISESVLAAMREYQIELSPDTVWIYDGNRNVGWYVNKSKGGVTDLILAMDSIILADNE